MRKEAVIAVFLLFFASIAAGETRATSVNPSVVAPGESFTVTVSLTNSGDSSSYFKPLVLDTPQGFKVVEGLDLGDTKLCDYCQSEDTVRIEAMESTDSGLYSFEVRPNSSIDKGVGSSDSFQISVNGSPNLLLKVENSTVGQESEDSISLVVKNIGNEAAYQVSGSLSIRNVELEPDNFVLGEIGPGEEVSKEITVQTGDSVRPGIKSAQVSFSYRDESKIVSMNTKASVNILEDPKLTVSSIQTNDPVIGEESRLLIEMENVGNGEADSISINLACDNSSLNKHKTFVGSLEEGESVPAVYKITPENEIINCDIGVDYMGAEKISMDEEFSFLADKEKISDLYILGAALLASGLVAIVWRRYR